MTGRLVLERAVEATAVALKAGTFVSWSASAGSSSGKVVSVHKGKVPGVISHAVATEDAPAARVQLYAKQGKGWAPTQIFLAQPLATLTAIEALAEPAEEAAAVALGSFDEIRQTVRDALCDMLRAVSGADHVYVYIADLGPGWAVYEAGSNWDDLWMVEYSIDDAGAVTFGTPVHVTKIIQYVPDAAAGEADAAMENTCERITGRLLGAKGIDPATGGHVYAVQLIAYGDSKNGRRYPEAVMRAATALYEGAKAYDHHRTTEELNSGTIVGLIGHYRNVVAGTSGLEADLHLLPSATHTAEALDQSLANQAEGLPLLVGISHDVMTTSKAVSENGRTLREVTAIVSVNSADVVSDPAAGGMVTRMVAGGAGDLPTPTTSTTKETTVTLKQLLALLRAAESDAKRAALLQEHAHILESAGVTGDDALRMAEALPAPAAAHTQDAPAAPDEPKIVRESAIGKLVVHHALQAAKLTQLAETITAELPEKFTEAELTAKIASAQRIAEAAEKAGLAPTVPHQTAAVTGDAFDKKVKALDAMLAGEPGGYRSLKEAYQDFTGRSQRAFDGEDFNREVLRESISLRRDGERIAFDSQQRGVESVQASTWGYVLGDSITRRMVAEYSRPSLQTWRTVVSSIANVNDFRTQRIDRVGGYGTLPTVNEGAAYQALTTPGNEEVTYAITKKGGTEDLTLETIANDDVRVIRQIPVKLGLAAAQTLFRFVWDFFPNNANIFDGSALFVGGHGNTTSAALSRANLSASRKAMRKQASYGDSSDVLSIVPKYLVTCSDLEELAWEICTSAVAIPTAAPDGAASNTPNLHQGMTPIVVDYWSSTTAWFLVADPTMVPTFEVGFYQGRQDPELFVQSDETSGSVFTADKVTYKIRHIYSGAVLDYRGLSRGNA